MTKPGFLLSRAPFALLLLSAVILLPPALQAGESEAETAQNHPSDFMLHRPGFFVGVHSGVNLPRADSDLFQMVTRELTLEKSDFRSVPFGFDFGIAPQDHLALVLSAEYGRTAESSEFRDFVEDNGKPITQRTEFSLFPLTAALRYYPIKMGETVGSYAWIPNRILPYVGGGGGVVRYQLAQVGDFVDMQTYNIFYAVLRSRGWAAVPFLVSGLDMGLTPRVFINVEAHYHWGKADLSSAFSGFRPIDLSGLRVSGGINVRF